MRSIYLDYCSTTPVAASVREAMLPFLSEFYGHPASSHWFGRAAQEAIEDARSNLASLLGCHPSEVLFTSGGTESVNLALLGIGRAISKNLSNFSPHIITTKLDHTCVHACVRQLEREGWESTSIGSDPDGVLDLDELQKAITPSTRIVSAIHASHRIGTIQPIVEIAEICKERDILLHTDASQSVGKIECDVNELGVDALSLSGHKFYAPKGVGALYLRTGVPIEAILFGEGCEAGIRPGTANVPHIVGLGQASKLAQAGMVSALDQTSLLRDQFHRQLEHAIGCKLRVHGEETKRLPGILSIELPGASADAIQRMLPELCLGPVPGTNGSGGTAILTHEALGLTADESASTLRISFGWTSSEEEIQQAVHMLATAYESICD